MTSPFQNLFDPMAKQYCQYRPSYPREFIEFVAHAARQRECAWDAGTGSGQAAVALAEHFEQVVATDSSQAQLAYAIEHPRVTYKLAAAENAGLAANSCDLVTAANAVHWFDQKPFYADVDRVLKVGGAIALWCYGPLSTEGVLNRKLDAFYGHIDPYWETGPLALVRAKYANLDFPFAEIQAPAFVINDMWSVERLLGYYSSWSSVQTCKVKTGCDAVAELATDLQSAGLRAIDRLEVTLPLYLRIGKKK